MIVGLRAISVGCAVPQPNFESTVHSVFENAVNLQLPTDGLLVTLLNSKHDLPQGVRLETRRAPPFEGLGIGARGICTDGVLRVDPDLVIDLRQADRWECGLSTLKANVRNQSVAAAWLHAWIALKERAAESGLAPIGLDAPTTHSTPRADISQRLTETMSQLVRATRESDLAGMRELQQLIGLGTGLTPSGDDLLTGYLAGLWCAARREPDRLRFLSLLRDLVRDLSRRTNDVSRTYLRLAARGQVSSVLADLAAAICAGAARERVITRAEAAMRVGHTSGMETVNGLLLGLAAWDGSELLA
jgi:Protein of unknown function (DUF2877)